jgi:hypothetical protein
MALTFATSMSRAPKVMRLRAIRVGSTVVGSAIVESLRFCQVTKRRFCAMGHPTF